MNGSAADSGRDLLRRRLSVFQLVLVGALLVVVVATQLLAILSYRALKQATSGVTSAQNVTGGLANAQRDALNTQLAIERLGQGTGPLSDVVLNTGFLGQQLRVLLPQQVPADVSPRILAATIGHSLAFPVSPVATSTPTKPERSRASISASVPTRAKVGPGMTRHARVAGSNSARPVSGTQM